MENLSEYRTWILILSGTVLTGWLFNRYWINRRFVISEQSLIGKTVLITGGNTGIGYETAKELLQRGARVIIACRNLSRGNDAMRKLLHETRCPSNRIRVMECDLSSFDSVRNLAKLYHHDEERLDILICNAGLGYSTDPITADGFHPVIQSNYLSHFLLTNLLLNKLKQSRPSRILNISSDLHKLVKSIDWSDAFTQNKQKGLMGAYAPSKVFQILSTYKLKKDLYDEGIDVFALTPGLVSTSIKDPIEESLGLIGSLFYSPLSFLMKFLFSKTPAKGAQTSVYCAVEPSLQKSKDLYFQNCSVCQSSSLSFNPASAETLWTLSSQAVGL